MMICLSLGVIIYICMLSYQVGPVVSFRLKLHRIQFIVCASSELSDETAHYRHALSLTFSANVYHKYRMSCGLTYMSH